MPNPSKRSRKFMYLSYVDGSGETNDKCRIGVYAAVLIPDAEFFGLETLAALAVNRLIPEDKREQFEEFKACDLFRGYSLYEGVSEEERFAVIDGLLGALIKYQPTVSVVYGSVDKDRLEEHDAASANPADVAFRLCLKGAEKFLAMEETRRVAVEHNEWESLMSLIIVDDDKSLKERLHKTFRDLRKPLRNLHRGQLEHVHDDLYFGDSRYSVGIQIADLCAYFIGLHLVGGDEKAEKFYQLFEGNIKAKDIFPPEALRSALA